MTDLDKAKNAAVRAGTFIDRFVEDHPRWSMAIFAAIEVLTIWLLWG